MKLRYVYWKENTDDPKPTGHILFEHVLSNDADQLMCGADIPESKDHPEYTKRIRRIPAYDMCPECLEAFKASNHPEAVAYRQLYELYGSER